LRDLATSCCVANAPKCAWNEKNFAKRSENANSASVE
jgi:hypothetical protein